VSLCLASAGVVKSLSVAAFMLTWTPSVEQAEWQEDWRVTPQGFEIAEARAKGSEAGTEMSPGARLIDGWYRWKPRLPVLPELVLRNSGLTGEWRLCSDGKCQDMSAILGRPLAATAITISVCSLEIAPKALDPKTLLARGDDFNIKGDLNRAIADYDAALKADPAFPEALNSRGMAWRAKGDRRRALSDFDAALRLKPDYEAARINRKSLFSEIERLGAQMPLKGKAN
jgi:hypothetical protein